MLKDRIYFDYASTTPTDPRVIEAMEPYFFERFGNTSSPHSFGREARKEAENSRQKLANLIHAQNEEIIFTSGGTESNNQAIIGTARALREKGNHLIISKIEHHSVIEPAAFLEKEGFKISYVETDSFGKVHPNQIKKLLSPKTILISIMHASNEIGTVQDIEAIGNLAAENKILFHVDAVQTVGHIPVNVDRIKCHLLSLSAHKFYGPKGVGALYQRKGTRISSYLLGGDQENGRRASTLNLSGIVGLGKAAELCQQLMEDEAAQQKIFRERLIQQILEKIPDVILNGHPEERLPNNVHFSFRGLESESLLMSLDMEGIAASMGSACTSGQLKASHVLKAIGLSDALAFGALRLSMGRWTTSEHIELLIKKLPDIVQRLRAANI